MSNVAGLSSSRRTPPPIVNRLTSTRAGGKLVAEYWDRLFTARERGATVVWYNGAAVNPIFQAAGVEWCHGEAFGARLAAMHHEGPAQRTGEEYGYINELCSYARTTLGCAVLTKRATIDENGVNLAGVSADTLASRLPAPDFFVNAYAGCSTGQQWDEISYRLFNKKLPFFKVSYPLLWGNRPDAGYLRGQEWEEASQLVAQQLHKLIEFLEVQTGKPFNWEALREAMHYIKRASELRLEAMSLCRTKPAPATFWDWIASIAPINFLPGNQALVDYFSGVKVEIEQRIKDGIVALPNERYRLAFDGIMNWNKVGWLAEKFARYDAAVVVGRYTHMAFWQEPNLIDAKNPVLGMAQNYLICPNNHSAPILIDLIMDLCRKYEVDGMVIHASRTCRAFTNPQFLIADAAHKRLGIQTTMFEGDVTDESFYKDELLNSRVEAMLEAIDARRTRAA